MPKERPRNQPSNDFAAKKFLARGLDRCGEKRKIQFIGVFQVVGCGTVKGFLVWSEFAGEHLVKPNALDGVHRGVGIDDFLSEGGLRGFAPLRKEMAAQKTHILAAAALQYL